MSVEGRKIFKNVVVLTMTEVLARGLGILLMIVMARRLGPALMGVHSFSLTFVGFFGILVDFGLDQYIQREVGRHPQEANSLLARVFSLKLGLYLFSIAVILLLLPFVADTPLKRNVVLIVAASLFFQTNITSVLAVFRGRLLASLEALVRMSFRLVYSLAGLWLLLAGFGLLGLVSLECLAQAGAFFMALIILRRKIGPLPGRFSLTSIFDIAGQTKAFFFIALVRTVFNSIDTVMLALMVGDVATGYYGITIRLIDAFDFLPWAFTGAFLPVLSREAVEAPERFAQTFKPFFRFVFLAGVGLGVILAGLSAQIILFLFGPKFLPAEHTLVLMSMVLILIFGNWPITMAIISLDLERQSLRIFAIGAVFNLILNLWAIKALEDQGAAWTTIASQLLLLFLQARVLGAEKRAAMNLAGLALRPIGLGLLTWVFIYFLKSFHLNLFWNLTAAGLCFTLLAFLTGALTWQDISLAKEYAILKKKRAVGK